MSLLYIAYLTIGAIVLIVLFTRARFSNDQQSAQEFNHLFKAASPIRLIAGLIIMAVMWPLILWMLSRIRPTD